MTTGRRQGAPGFALLEALVVLAVSALVVLTLVMATNLMVRGWGRAAAQSNAIEGLSTGLAVVRRDLASARRLHWGSADTGGPLFYGTRNAVGVVVGQDGTAPGSGDSMVLIEARYADNGGALVRSASPLRPDATSLVSGAYGTPVTLMSGQWTFRFSYGARRSTGLSWGEAWTDTKKMPASIRLEVIETRSGLAVVPPLVVPLRVDAEPGCVGSGSYCSVEEPKPDENPPADGKTGNGK